MSKASLNVGKILLVSAIGLTSVGGGVVFPTNTVQATTEKKEINFEQVGTDFFQFLNNSNWDQAYTLLNSNTQKIVGKPQLEQLWKGFTAPYGTINQWKFLKVQNDGVHTKVSFLCSAQNGKYEFVIKLDKQGKVDEFIVDNYYPENSFLKPSYDLKNYTEKQVVIGENDTTLPGLLTIPKGKGPFPVVVLVHGSGTSDMDETTLGHRPFRDLAVGLASQGIAVLRYDKQTKTHAIKAALNPTFTIKEETVNDAVSAVKLVSEQPEIDRKQIYVLGHSQGGFALPKIIQKDTNKLIKGVISAAGPSSKFSDLFVWQLEQMVVRAKKSNAPAEMIAALDQQALLSKQQFALLNDPKFSITNPPKDFILPNGFWWYDLRQYVPTDLAKKQDVPMFVVQGGKDIQVPVSEFEQLKKELKNRSNVQYKLYPNMFHLLSNYEGEPDGKAEYATPSIVAPELITDIAKWIKKEDESTPSLVDPTQFTDYKDGLYWSDAIKWALNKRIVFGFDAEKKLKPDLTITESQYLRMILRYTSSHSLKEETIKAVYEFAKENNLKVTGKPNANLTRGQAAVLLSKTFTKQNLTEKQAVQWLYDQGVIDGFDQSQSYESFKPTLPISRAHLVTILYNLDQIK